MCSDCISLGLNDPDGIDDLIESFMPKRRQKRKDYTKQLPLYREIFELSKQWCRLELQLDTMPYIEELYKDGKPLYRAIKLHLKANDIMNNYFYVPVEWNEFSQERIDSILAILLVEGQSPEEELPGNWEITTGYTDKELKASIKQLKEMYAEIEATCKSTLEGQHT